MKCFPEDFPDELEDECLCSSATRKNYFLHIYDGINREALVNGKNIVHCEYKTEAMEQKILKHFEELMKDHCCRSYCDDHDGVPKEKCKKDHLYCGYEMDHGIELSEVIEIIKDLIDKEEIQINLTQRNEER